MVSEKTNKLFTQNKKAFIKKSATEAVIGNAVDTQFKLPEDNNLKTSKFLYKILVSDGDYVKLQEEVVSYLNDGWILVGGVSLAIHADPYSKMTIFSQAIQKTI
jgi:hypothetical protein